MELERFLTSTHKIHPHFKTYASKPIAPYVPFHDLDFKIYTYVIAFLFNTIVIPFAIIALYIIHKPTKEQQDAHEHNMRVYNASFACGHCGKVGGSDKGKVYKYHRIKE